MALTPEQLRMAISGYRGAPSLAVPQLQPGPIDPALLMPPPPMPEPAPMPPVMAPEPPPLVAPMPATVARPASYKAGVQQAIDSYRGATGEAVQVAKAIGAAKGADSTAKAGIVADRKAEVGADVGPDRTASTASGAVADDLFAQYRAKQAEIDKTEIKRDRRTDNQRTVDVIASAFAGIGDALSNMGNHPTDTLGQMQADIKAGIQQDVDDQRMALNDKRASADAKLTEYGIARQILGDDKQGEEKAYEWAQAKAAQRYALAIDEQTAKSGSTIEKLAGEATSAQLKAAAAATELGVWQHLESSRMAMIGNSARLTPQQTYTQEKDARDEANKAASREIPDLEPTRPLVQITDKQANEAADVMSTYGKLENNLAEMKQLATEDYSLVSDHPVEQYKKLKTADKAFQLKRETTTAMLTQAAGSGVPGAQEALRVFEGLPEPSALADLSPVDRAAVYDAAADNYKNLKRIAIESQGAYRLPKEPGKPGRKSGSKPTKEAQPQANVGDVEALKKKFNFTPTGG